MEGCRVSGSSAVDAYIAALPADRRASMQQLREIVRAAAPEAEELISYKMPAFRSHGLFLVSYDAYKRHYSLFPSTDPVIEACGDAIRPYQKGRGTISFPASEPLPADLVRKIIKARVAEIAARAGE
jgi:uncharacterized protein YdhG (YjbR/CyaY superfamily)